MMIWLGGSCQYWHAFMFLLSPLVSICSCVVSFRDGFACGPWQVYYTCYGYIECHLNSFCFFQVSYTGDVLVLHLTSKCAHNAAWPASSHVFSVSFRRKTRSRPMAVILYTVYFTTMSHSCKVARLHCACHTSSRAWILGFILGCLFVTAQIYLHVGMLTHPNATPTLTVGRTLSCTG